MRCYNFLRNLQTSSSLIFSSFVIGEEFCKHFSSIFNNSHVVVFLLSDLPICPNLGKSQIDDLNDDIFNKEILDAFHDIHYKQVSEARWIQLSFLH